jgi:hypothetical protein
LALAGCAGAPDDSGDVPPAVGDHEARQERAATSEQVPATPVKDDPARPPAFQPVFGDSPGGADPTAKPTSASSVGAECIDNGDPGGSENVATMLPDTDDCDTDLKTLKGIAKGGVDVDFYKLAAKDSGISFKHPFGCRINADFENETAGTELCVYARCANSSVDAVTGCDGGTVATSEIGMKGCCVAGPGRANPQWDCSGLDDSVDFFLRVRQQGGDQCLPYSVKYRF